MQTGMTRAISEHFELCSPSPKPVMTQFIKYAMQRNVQIIPSVVAAVIKP